MLCDLYIRDFVIARKLHLEFASGLTVLTGETGAGKSILVGALGLVLGDRADSQTVRTGTEKSEISAVFDIGANATAQSWLAANDLDSDGECVIRRVVLASGRSRAFINGKPATLQQLKQLGHQLVEIHGQHEHQAMVRGPVQRQWLDAYAAHPQLLLEVAQTYESWETLRRKFADFKQTLNERSARVDLLRFQTEEINKLAIVEGEAASLSAEQYRLSHVATLAESGEAALLALMADDTGTLASLARARRALAHIKTIDPELSEYDELLDGADIQITEAVSGLQRYLKDLDMDPERRDFVEQRLDSISGLAKKHRVEPDQLLQHLQTLQDELVTLDHAEEALEEMEQALQEAAANYQASATTLTLSRRTAAKKMARAITLLVHELGMPESEFGIDITPLEDNAWRREGCDQVTFLIKANPGEPARPVSKVASGGELSRLSLAVQVISAAVDSSACMVFDEVDAGVGGAVADMIGKRLQELGLERQVLAVTHLPQVASHGTQHFKVSKASIDKRTHSQVQELNATERVAELARMLGGAKVTATTRKHAKEMLTQASRQRESA